MRGLTPIPFTKSSIPRGDQAGRTIPTHHLRAYRLGTAAMLLHLVVQGELATRCSREKKTEEILPCKTLLCPGLAMLRRN